MNKVTIYHGEVWEVLQTLPADSIQCCVTSPPYWGLRDYGVPGQLGLEKTPEEYLEKMVLIFREVRRVLRPDGSLWLNCGDTYFNGDKWGGGGANTGKHTRTPNGDVASWQAVRRKWGKVDGLKPKDLCGIPWRLALALQADGWWLRSDIIWAKPNPMPESVTDRPTTAHEHIFLLTKSAKYFYDAEAVREEGPTYVRKAGGYQDKGSGLGEGTGGTDGRRGLGFKNKETVTNGRNLRSVWTIATTPFSDWAETSRQVRVELDAVSDGMMHKVSPDCPVHGCLYHQDSSHCDDVRGAVGQSRKGRNNIHHVQERLFDCAPTEKNPGANLPLSSSDLQGQPCSLSATVHSKQSHKTAHGLETTSPCISFDETPCHIDDKSELPLTVDSAGRIFENSISLGDSDDHLSVQTLCRIVDKSSLPIPPECLCSFYQEVTQKSSHFATFPPAIPERCIKAGSKEGDLILDPFSGAGTTAMVAAKLGRDAVGIELNPEYVKMSVQRLKRELGMLVEIEMGGGPESGAGGIGG